MSNLLPFESARQPTTFRSTRQVSPELALIIERLQAIEHHDRQSFAAIGATVEQLSRGYPPSRPFRPR